MTNTRGKQDDNHLLSTEAHIAIREGIIRGQFPPDSRITVDRVARDLGLSAIPVREALRALEVEGWVYFIPRRGAFVSARTPEEAKEVLETRLILEPEIAAVSALRRTEENLASLAVIISDGHETARANDLTKFLVINTDFHKTLAACTHNSVLIRLYERVLGYVEFYYGAAVEQRISRSATEHEAIFQAILNQDAELARKLAAQHIKATFEVFSPTGRSVLRSSK